MELSFSVVVVCLGCVFVVLLLVGFGCGFWLRTLVVDVAHLAFELVFLFF